MGLPLRLARNPRSERSRRGQPRITRMSTVASQKFAGTSRAPSRAGQYLAATKPRIVLMLVFTAIIGMLLAAPGIPPWRALVFGTLGIWMASSSAAALNQLIDQRIDRIMARTAHRPLVTGALTTRQVLTFAIVLGVASMLVLGFLVN